MSPESNLAWKFISGNTKLLNIIKNIAIVIPNNIGALIMDKKLIPEARMALISLSSESLPNVIKVASRTAIGAERAKIHARFKNKYSSIVNMSKPFPRNLSIALSKKFTNKIKVIIKREKIKGRISSFKRYLFKSITLKVTNMNVNISIEFLLETDLFV